MLALDDEQQFKFIADFVREDSAAAFADGKKLLASADARERALGADILGQLRLPYRRRGDRFYVVLAVLGAVGVVVGLVTAARNPRSVDGRGLTAP